MSAQQRQTLEYIYRPSIWSSMGEILLFGGGTFFSIHEARFNDRGLIVNHLFHLGVEGANIFYWCLALACGVFAVIAVAAFFVGISSARQVKLTAHGLSVPKNRFSREPPIVPYGAIKTVEMQTCRRRRFLNVTHASGKLVIAEALLPNRAAFNHLAAALTERHANAKMPSSSGRP